MLASSVVHAQLDGTDRAASQPAGGAGPAAVAPSGASPLLRVYLDANRRVLAGQSSLASALGLAGAAGQARQAGSVLAGGAGALTPAALSQVGGAQQSVAQALAQAFASGGAGLAPIDPAGFSEGLVSLGQGVVEYAQLRSGLDHPDGANPPPPSSQTRLDPGNPSAASFIARNARNELLSIGSTLRLAVRFAVSHGMAVPPVATSALELLR
ncbi:hypothetical protein [Burkholderia alba]|uniref:hypothetical protein n=1 Tax=Burkholderia alba TaxID=2683677 RepID=UPI002B05A527|nr:hypothetical protein [Burkholderia alba]